MKAKRKALPKDALSKLKMTYLDQGGLRDNAAYGWVRADSDGTTEHRDTEHDEERESERVALSVVAGSLSCSALCLCVSVVQSSC